jgi:nucleotide-binding universal stress UspA family protein
MDTRTENLPIVAGVDGSRFGVEALRWALAEAERRDCGVRALLVAHTAPVAAAGRPTIVSLTTTLTWEPGQEYVSELQGTLRAVLGEHDDPRLRAEVVQGGPPEVLSAASAAAQLLVVGRRGHGWFAGAVLGSVASYCVRRAACPVVVIPVSLAAPDAPNEAGTPEPMSYGLGPLL